LGKHADPYLLSWLLGFSGEQRSEQRKSKSDDGAVHHEHLGSVPPPERRTPRISRGAALRAVGWMRLFDDDVRMA
jgi:hypothetical protein